MATIILNTKVMLIEEVSIEKYLNKFRPYLKDIIIISKNLIHAKFN